MTLRQKCISFILFRIRTWKEVGGAAKIVECADFILKIWSNLPDHYFIFYQNLWDFPPKKYQRNWCKIFYVPNQNWQIFHSFVVQWGFEYQTSPVFIWSKVVRSLNGLVYAYWTKFNPVSDPHFNTGPAFKWGLNTWLPFGYWTSGYRSSESLLFRCFHCSAVWRYWIVS